MSARVSRMNTTFFYAPPDNVKEGRVVLPDEESHHALRVLRLGNGDEIEVVDGQGCWYRVRLDTVGPGPAEGEIAERRLGVGESRLDLHLAVGVLKSRSRLEWILEKATELGVSRITLLDTRHSERSRIDLNRARRVLRAAMKQCLRSRVVEIAGPTRFEQFIERTSGPNGLLCAGYSTGIPMWRALDSVPTGRPVVVAVGPEGGFGSEEIETAEAAGYLPVSLGRRRLRSETAAIAACSLIMNQSHPE